MGRLERQVKELDDYFASLEHPEEHEGFTAPFRVTDWGIERYQGKANDIQWLIKDVMPQGTACLMASMGGVGKSYLILDTAIAIATGPSMIGRYALGGEVVDSGAVVVVSAEDSHTAIHRRIDQILSEKGRAAIQDNFYMVPLPDAGGSITFIKQVHGEYMMTEEWLWFCQEVKRIPNLKFIALDPLQVFVQADITSDPAAAQVWWSAVSSLCAETGACVMAAHHMRKGNEHIETLFQAREQIRGTTGLVDGARWVYALWMASQEEREAAAAALGDDMGPMSMIKGGVCKSNEFGSDKITVYIRDESGLLIDRSEEVSSCLLERTVLDPDQIREIFQEVVRRWDAQDPFSGHHAGRDRYLGKWISENFDIEYKAAKRYVDDWIKKRNLVKEPHPKIPNSSGIRRRETPDV